MANGTDYMQKLGLTMYQARAVTVLFKQDTTAPQIAELTGIHPSKIYQVLKSLAEWEIEVESSPGKARVYKKLSAKRTINKLLNKKQSAVASLSAEKAPYIEYLTSLRLSVQINRCESGRHELSAGDLCFCSNNAKGVN